MNDEQLLRYSRHLLLPGIDIDGQQAIADAHVMIIGLGGLGSPVALYLAAAGVGTLSLVDDDVVELSNLQRQIAHSLDTVGRSKVASAAARCRDLNPEVITHTHEIRADRRWLTEHLRNNVAVVVDCSDNSAVRYALNDACLSMNVPWVSGAAVEFSGQVAVFDPRQIDAPCYRCLYPSLKDEALSCSENGILSPLVGVVGSLQSTEVLRLLTGFGQPQHGLLRTYDARSGDWQRWKVPVRKACESCQGAAE